MADEVETELELGAFTWHPSRRREDGGTKATSRLVLRAVGRGASAAAVVAFLPHVTSILRVRLSCPLVLGVESWAGCARTGPATFKPPGDRARERGEETGRVEFALLFSEGSDTNLEELVRFRMAMDAAGEPRALVELLVAQADLPFSPTSG